MRKKNEEKQKKREPKGVKLNNESTKKQKKNKCC